VLDSYSKIKSWYDDNVETYRNNFNAAKESGKLNLQFVKDNGLDPDYIDNEIEEVINNDPEVAKIADDDKAFDEMYYAAIDRYYEVYRRVECQQQ